MADKKFVASSWLKLNGDIGDMTHYRYGQPGPELTLTEADGAVNISLRSDQGLQLHECPTTENVYGYRTCAEHDVFSFKRIIPGVGDAVFELRGLLSGSYHLKTNRLYDWWSTVPGTRVSSRIKLLGALTDLACIQSDIIPLHCSAVEVNGRAILIMAAPDTGKTTTSLALAQRGYGVIAEDIALARADGRLAGCPFTRTVETPQSLAKKRNRNRYKTSIIEARPQNSRVVTEPIECAAVVFLKRGGNGGIRSVDPAETFKRMRMLNLLEFDFYRREPFPYYLGIYNRLDDLMERERTLTAKFIESVESRVVCTAATPSEFASLIESRFA